MCSPRSRPRDHERPHDRDSRHRPDGGDIADAGRLAFAGPAAKNGALAHRGCSGDRAGRRGRGCFAAGGQAAQRQPAAGGAPISLAILPFRNASGDPTLNSLGSSLSQVLGTELGQSSRVRTGALRPDAPGPSGSADRAQLDAGPAGARARRRLHEREARALGPVLALRRRDSHRRDAAGSRRRAERAAQRHGRQRGEPPDGDLAS